MTLSLGLSPLNWGIFTPRGEGGCKPITAPLSERAKAKQGKRKSKQDMYNMYCAGGGLLISDIRISIDVL